jgi:recombination protein RecA
MAEDIFEKLKEGIAKNIKGVHVATMSESNIAKDRFWVKTPCMDLNRILSGSLNRGIPSRNLMAIVGPEHSMKSSFMVLCMIEAQQRGYKPVIIDTEGGVNEDFCRRWGLDPSSVLYIYTPWISEIKSTLAQIKDTHEEGYVIGIDSVGGIDRLKSYDDALEGTPKADQGLLQKEIRSMLKLFLNICVSQNSVGIASGHYYGSPSSVPKPDQIGGGKAMKLFPSILVSLKKTTIEDSNKQVTGNEIIATTLKNRIYPPFQTATVKIDYKTGVQQYAGILDLAIQANLVVKSGAWYSYAGERMGQGMDNATQSIEKFPRLIEQLEEWLKTTGYSTFSKEIKEAEEIIQNEIQVVAEEEKPRRKKKNENI